MAALCSGIWTHTAQPAYDPHDQEVKIKKSFIIMKSIHGKRICLGVLETKSSELLLMLWVSAQCL